MFKKRIFSIFGLILFFALLIPACSKAPAVQATGGLTRLRIENTVIEVEGGFILGQSGEEILIRLQGLSARIYVYPWEKIDKATPERLKFRVNNLYSSRIKVEGVQKYQSTPREISFQLDLLPNQSQCVKLQTKLSEQSFNFVVLGDSRDNPTIFKKILRNVVKHNPLFIAHCGDFVAEGTDEEYQEFTKTIQETDFPLLFALGNHDVRNGGRRTAQELFGPPNYSFTFSDCHFIFLDNSLLRLENAEYRWLSAELEANKNLRNFIFMHVPAFDPRDKQNHAMDLALNAQWFLDLVERYKVKAVFASHIHNYLEREKGDTHYFITGGGGAPLVNSEAFFHYLLVTVSQEGFKTEVISVE